MQKIQAPKPFVATASMVRAILRGAKTQHRQPIKLPHQNSLGEWTPALVGGHDGGRLRDGSTIPLQGGIFHTRTGEMLICPLGQPGDHLWVRESWRGIVKINAHGEPYKTGVARYTPEQDYCERIEYAATQPKDSEPWRSSTSMPRWASRITLEITKVKVSRLQDTRDEDMLSEGFTADGLIEGVAVANNVRGAYAYAWNQTHQEDSWEKNPWVWVVQFRKFDGKK